MNTLAPGVNATHDTLEDCLDNAATVRPDATQPRELYPATDTFLARTSRHTAAVNAVLVPAARRRLPDGHRRAHELVHQSRRLEVALAQVKAKLYGSSYAIRRRWPQIWDDVRREFDATWELEQSLAESLDEHPDPRGRDLAEKLYDAELRAPTRPHPYVPHVGLRGRVARGVCRRVDNFWDATEGRMIPAPVPHDSSH